MGGQPGACELGLCQAFDGSTRRIISFVAVLESVPATATQPRVWLFLLQGPLAFLSYIYIYIHMFIWNIHHAGMFCLLRLL